MKDSLLAQRRQVAERAAAAFAKLPQVAAILVFGSVANGLVDDVSDVDMLVITHAIPIPDVVRHQLLYELGTGWATGVVTGNALFPLLDLDGIVDHIAVSVHYQQVSWIEEVLQDVLEQGAIRSQLLPFRPYTLVGLLQRGWLLFDPFGFVAKWREQALIFPPQLRRNLVGHFMPILQEETDELVGAARRELGPANFLFHLNRSLDALIRLLYAVNETYDPADRRESQTIWPFLSIAPENFVPRLAAVLEGPFDTEGMRLQARQHAKLVSEVQELVRQAAI